MVFFTKKEPCDNLYFTFSYARSYDFAINLGENGKFHRIFFYGKKSGKDISKRKIQTLFVSSFSWI